MNVFGFTGDPNFHSSRISTSEYISLTGIDNGSQYEELMSVYEAIDTNNIVEKSENYSEYEDV